MTCRPSFCSTGYSMTSVPYTLEAMAEVPTMSGRLVTLGVSAGPMAEINMQVLYRKSLTVHGYGGLIEPEQKMAAARAAALAALADGRLGVAVAQRLPLERVNDAFAAIVDRTLTGKVVLELGRPGSA